MKRAVAHQPGDGEKEGEGKEDGGCDADALSLPCSSEPEFFVRFGDFLRGGHSLEVSIINIEGVALIDVTCFNPLEKPVDTLF